ncbi:ThuA domain-containing protein [Sphingobium sp. CR2-8]|uniref:ThuA domain-containing protein n=1 Tax=Sphingobium sp. CR2-8 TaxID=1306534 RepID=UPI002DB5724E|nr:ThuA domain-containing protein [Sphingobium sp. CR2-8]MEC3909280.1 ThuA domain-containing protein [Sphingobium sp. CR2-8]
MKHLWMTGAGLLMAMLPASVMARPVTDCALRDAPFSIESPMIDIVRSAPAKAAVEAGAPDVFTALPPRFFSPDAPSFAAILTLKALGKMKNLPADKLAALDKRLRALPVTAADRTARCARYDNDRPTIALPRGKPRLLIFEKINGFRDGPSVDAARAAFQAMAQRKGWAVVVSDKGGVMTPANLRRFDAVIWNNISGDVLTLSQRAAFKSYIEQGGGYVAVHGSSGDPSTFWPWYVDTLVGTQFAGHPMNPQFQDARIVVEGRDHPVAAGLPHEWTMNDEWYSFTANPRPGSTVLATLDEGSYKPSALAMGDHPIAWTRCVGKGRAFYSGIGHRPQTYADPHYVTMLENAVVWAASRRATCPVAKQ